MTAASAPEIQTQLDRILASPAFAASPQLCDFLRYVVKKTLAGKADEIKQYTVATECLGYEPKFDPITNPAVRLQARRLRRALGQPAVHYREPIQRHLLLWTGPACSGSHAVPCHSVPVRW